jgi:hypothetical protein
MYEVGPWFVHLMNLAILAIVGIVIMVAILFKKGQYQKEAAKCVQAELLTATGWPEFHTVKCGINDAFVQVGNGQYKLDPNHKEWGSHPRLPFMGLASLQAPIRKGTWFKDNPNVPLYGKAVPAEVTAAEIQARVREAAAIAIGAQIMETDARQRQLNEAIANQPNKMVVYGGFITIIIGVVIIAINTLL